MHHELGMATEKEKIIKDKLFVIRLIYQNKRAARFSNQAAFFVHSDKASSQKWLILNRVLEVGFDVFADAHRSPHR